MIVGDIFELSIVGVFDRGIPNQERIVLSARNTVNMGQFGMMLGIQHQQNLAYPIRDNLYWFGEGVASSGDWIFLYTGLGQVTQQELPGSHNKVYSLHWGREKTILHQSEVVPILFRVDAVAVGNAALSLPRGSGQST